MSRILSDTALQRLLSMAAAGDGDDECRPVRQVPPPLPPRYEIVRELGRGGMGIVYEAIDHQLGRRCALKTLGAAGADEQARRRFAREAQAAAALRHPHIAAVYDATPDYISMQLVAGGAIDVAHPSERRLIAELIRDAARALHHGHEQGFVHRDVKPSNLLVEGRHVHVVDFGLAKAIAHDASHSLPGGIVGTPAFMAPEQALGRSDSVDARSDVYGLGATLYCCLAGKPPFAATDLPELLRQVVEDEPAAPRADRDLDLIISKCLAKDPAQRYQTAAELADDLDRWLRDEPVQARRPSLLYRARKRLQRQRKLWRAAAAAALVAATLVAVVVVPPWLRARRDERAASEALELATETATILQNAAMHARMGDHDSAHEVLDQGIAAARAFLARHEVPRARHLLARLLRARGAVEDALAELARVLASDPSLADARFERGLLLATLPGASEHDLATARQDLAIGIPEQTQLTDVDRLFGRAELLRLCGEHAPAMEVFKEVLEYDPTNLAARMSLSRSALQLGDADLARYYAASVFDLQRGYGPVFLARERSSLPTAILGLDFALVDFAAAVRNTPDHALAIAHRGIQHLRRAVRLSGEGREPDALAALRSAIADHRHTLGVHAHVAGARNNLAACLLTADRMLARAGDAAGAAAARSEAEAELGRAIELAPDLPELHYNQALAALRVAELLRALGHAAPAERRRARSIAALARALQCAPADWRFARACRDRLTAR